MSEYLLRSLNMTRHAREPYQQAMLYVLCSQNTRWSLPQSDQQLFQITSGSIQHYYLS